VFEEIAVGELEAFREAHARRPPERAQPPRKPTVFAMSAASCAIGMSSPVPTLMCESIGRVFAS
jgi:hypothetical protein